MDVICMWGFVIVLFVVMSLLSRWDDMDGGIELLADGVWAAEDDKTGFLTFGVDIFDQTIFRRATNFFAHCTNEYYETKIWEMSIIEKTQQTRNMRLF